MKILENLHRIIPLITGTLLMLVNLCLGAKGELPNVIQDSESKTPHRDITPHYIAMSAEKPQKMIQGPSEPAQGFWPQHRAQEGLTTTSTLSKDTSSELPVFRRLSPQPEVQVAPSLHKEPILTPAPVLSVLPPPQTVIDASVGEKALLGMFYNVVTTALERSPRIRNSRLLIDAAKEDVINVKGQRWPQMDLTSSSRSYEFGGGARKSSEGNLPNLGLNVATNLVDFGETSNTIKSREFSVKAADSHKHAQSEDIAWEVSSSLIELIKQRLIIEMSHQYVSRMHELVKMLDGIVQSDPGRRSELTQASSRYLQAQSALDNAVAKARDKEIVLYRLVGETQVPLPTAMQWQLSAFKLQKLLALVDKHPVLEKARAQSQAALAESEALKSSSMPKVNWVVTKTTGKDFQGREQSWQTGINLSWGVFRGGSSRAAEQAAVQRAAAIREETQDTREDLEQRIRAAEQDAFAMLQRADLFRNLTRESDRIRLDFFDQWYHLGKRTLLDVLSGESDYYNNRIAEITNRFDGYNAIFRGYASAGQLVKWLQNSSAE